MKFKSITFRYVILAAVLLLITYTGYMHQIYQEVYPSVDALCPFGGLESLYSLVFQEKFLHRVFSSSLVLFVITIFLVIISGRSFCGWICPLGTLQGIMTGIKKKLKGKKSLIKIHNHRTGQYLRYIVLAFFTLGAWYGGKLLIRTYEPWVAWMHLAEFEHALYEFPVGMGLLFIMLVVSFFISRPFCRFLCPMGGFLGLINTWSPFSIRRNQDLCTQCSLCDNTCPVDIQVSMEDTVNRHECISCGDCVSRCPSSGALSFQLINISHISQFGFGLLIMIVFFGSIYAGKVSGYYVNTPPGIEELKAQGDMTPERIKGYMSLEDIAFLFDLEMDRLYDQLGLSKEQIPPSTKSRDISGIIQKKFDTDIVRVGVGALLNISESDIQKSCSPGETSGSAGFIYGTMTLRQVSESNQISLENLYEALNLDPDAIPPETQCKELKFLVSPDFHTSKVRNAVSGLNKHQ